MMAHNGPLAVNTLEDMVSAIHFRNSSIPGLGCAFSRLTGLRHKIGPPTMVPILSSVQHARMRVRLVLYGENISREKKYSLHENYTIGEEVLIFSPKSNKFIEKGLIESYVQWTDLHCPPSVFCDNEGKKGKPMLVVESPYISPHG